METKATTVELLFEKAGNYIKTTVELTKLNVVDKSSDVLSSLLTRIILLVVVALFSFLINIGLSLWIGELLGKWHYGFFVVAGGNLALILLLYLFRNSWIKILITNLIISKIVNQKQHEKG